MREKITYRDHDAYLQGRISIDGSTVEVWGILREAAMCRVVQGETSFDFDAEWYGWHPVYLVYIPLELNDGHRALESSDIERIAEIVHCGLCRLKMRNVVLLAGHRFEPVSVGERDETLREFDRFMQDQGWRVRVNDSLTSIKLKRRWLDFKAKRRPDKVPQGRWIAKAFDALRREPSDYRTLFVSEKARYSTVAYWIEW